jgi:hypothetical protein
MVLGAGQKAQVISKISIAKRAGDIRGVAQAVEYHPSQHKAMSSNPELPNRKKSWVWWYTSVNPSTQKAESGA